VLLPPTLVSSAKLSHRSAVDDAV
jgi:hypothetical protein